ncbi:Sulfotransferase family [Micractinium conductrix]|uniref:Sulfotransferase family n=1 Tax=Micractinium conductrix TaxID=554055 RepID=A0A2P6V107_9CHLO|nr:Sulfotransferase family [Micractinium conductrix]|eukprot:PSC67763.1 Sulfotransferase family [Micractinium conductrix]
MRWSDVPARRLGRPSVLQKPGPRWALALAVLAAAAVIPLGCLLAAHLFGGSGGPFALYQWTQPAREVSDQQAPLEAPSLLQGSERGHQTSTLPVARLPPSQLRGPVRKTGPLISDRVLPSHFQAACQQAGWWAWLEGLAVPGSPAPRQPCQHCQLFINTEYKFAYLRLPKTGGYTIVTTLGECDAAPGKPGCLTPLWKEVEAMGEGEAEALLQRIHQDFFVFTSLRDPYERAVHMYSFLMLSTLPSPATCRYVMDWDRFCDNPVAFAQACAQQPHCCYALASEEGNGALRKASHIHLQAPCVLAADGGLAVDYVVRHADLAADLAAALAAINARRDPGLPELALPPRLPAPLSQGRLRQRCRDGRSQRHRQHSPVNVTAEGESWAGLVAKEDYCSTADYYSGPHAHCKAAIARYYAADLQLVYPREPPGGSTL